jgi:hypothetical protein
MSEITLATLVADIAAALRAVDASRPRESNKNFKPGIGPLGEPVLLQLAADQMRSSKPIEYQRAGPQAYPGTRAECDLVIPGQWAIELKLARPYGDNGRPAEHWSENLLHPYPGNTSAIGDCLKLLGSGFAERKCVVVVGYEHSPPKTPLEPALHAFELLAAGIAHLRLSSRHTASITALVHPFHQQATVAGWEVLGEVPSTAA